VHSRVGEADRVQHATGKLRDAGSRVTMTRLRAHGLGDEATQRVQLDDGRKLAAEPRRACGEENGILERGAERADGRPAHRTSRARRARGDARRSSRTLRRESSSAAYDGPACPESASVYGDVG